MEHPFLMFLDHTQRRSTVGRTPLDEWSARRRDLHLTITRPEESYRLCCVVVCDLETSRMGAPYIYHISRLRVNVPNYMCTEWLIIISTLEPCSSVSVRCVLRVLLHFMKCAVLEVFIGYFYKPAEFPRGVTLNWPTILWIHTFHTRFWMPTISFLILTVDIAYHLKIHARFEVLTVLPLNTV